MTSQHHQSGATQTAFTVSIEAAHGISTGISAADRALTVQVAANPNAVHTDLICPGHIFPLRANDGRSSCAPRAHRSQHRFSPFVRIESSQQSFVK
jgi:3,4-dihydroxy-2-butanone 4-phosphate synthase